MKKEIYLSVLIVLTVLMQFAFIASAEQNVNIKTINETLNKLIKEDQINTAGIRTMASAVAATGESATVIEQRREGSVGNGIGRYFARIQIGSDPNNIFSVTFFIPENGYWQSSTDKAFVIFNGEGLTADNLADTGTNDSLAIFIAEQGRNVFIVGRTSDYTQEGNLSFMKYITPESEDYCNYLAILYAKLQTSSMYEGSPIPIAYVNTTLLGYSMGAFQSAWYLANVNPDSWGRINNHISVEMAVKFDPEKDRKLIENQKKHHNALVESWNNDTYSNDEMAGMIGAAYLALTDPDNSSNFMPHWNNIQVWRELLTRTYRFEDYPPTSDFRYFNGNKNRLYRGVNEERILSSNLKAAPHSPLIMDIWLSGSQGNVQGFEINASKIQTRTLCVGVGGGFGKTACTWYINEVKNANVTTMEWSNNDGHGSWLFDKEAKKYWAKIIAWDNNN